MEMNILYIVSTLKRVGPSNQTLNIIKNNTNANKMVLTIFDEPNDTMLPEYEEAGIKVKSLHISSFSKAVLTGKKKLLRFLQNEKFDIVHTYGIIPDFLASYVTKKIGIKHIITLRNFPKEDILTRYNGLKGKFVLALHVKVLKNARYLICCSKAISEKIEKEYGIKSDFIQNGVDTEKFKPTHEPVNIYEKYNYRMIISANIIKRKRIDESIEGFIKACIPSSCLIIIGDGPLLSEYKMKYKKENIYFEGKKSNVIKCLNLCNIFISSSESEGLPNSVLEAISCDLIPILSNIPQHLEIKECIGADIAYYELGNIEQLALKIKEVCSKQKKGYRKELLESNLTMKKMSNKYFSYYRSIL